MSANSISDGLLRFLHLYFSRRTVFSFVRVALALLRTMAQPLRSRTRTQPHYPHRLQPVLPFRRTEHPRLQHLMPLPQLAAQDDALSELLQLINRQLTEKDLKVEKASAAVIDATIIQTAGSKQRQAIEVDDEEGQVSGQTTPSKDSDARWIKKNGLYKLGYKQHTRTDSEIAFRRHFAPKERWILQKFFGFALRTQAA